MGAPCMKDARSPPTASIRRRYRSIPSSEGCRRGVSPPVTPLRRESWIDRQCGSEETAGGLAEAEGWPMVLATAPGPSTPVWFCCSVEQGLDGIQSGLRAGRVVFLRCAADAYP